MKSVDFKQLKKHNLKAQYFPVSIDENILVKTRDYFKPYTRTENGGKLFVVCSFENPIQYDLLISISISPWK